MPAGAAFEASTRAAMVATPETVRPATVACPARLAVTAWEVATWVRDSQSQVAAAAGVAAVVRAAVAARVVVVVVVAQAATAGLEPKEPVTKPALAAAAVVMVGEAATVAQEAMVAAAALAELVGARFPLPPWVNL
jgi:hypothetical protein